jgi:trans-aconitate 2-methyltransferase
MSTWNPAQYNRFSRERRQPFFDLLGLLQPHPHMRIVDLGCGTGETTAILHERLAAAQTLGLDSADTMLAGSAARDGDGLSFALADIGAFAARATYDLVFSNAALHWLPDHAALFARLTAALRPGGQLAVQMPYNFDQPSHTTAAAVAAEPPFLEALGGFSIGQPVAAPHWYAALLYRLGYAEQHLRVQVYGHVLDARDDVVEWVKGSLLTAYQQRLPADLWPQFIDRYRRALLPQLADTQPFFFPFKRLLLWGRLP